MNERIQEYTERCYRHLASAENLEAEFQEQLRAFRDETSDFAAFLASLRNELEDLDKEIAEQEQDLSDVVRQDHVVAHDSDNVAEGEKPRNYHLLVQFPDAKNFVEDNCSDVYDTLEALRQLREAGAVS